MARTSKTYKRTQNEMETPPKRSVRVSLRVPNTPICTLKKRRELSPTLEEAFTDLIDELATMEDRGSTIIPLIQPHYTPVVPLQLPTERTLDDDFDIQLENSWLYLEGSHGGKRCFFKKIQEGTEEYEAVKDLFDKPALKDLALQNKVSLHRTRVVEKYRVTH